MIESPTTIYLIDDDPSVRGAISRLLRSSGIECLPFSSAEEFLSSNPDPDAGCIISDILMPGLSGLGMPARLAAQGLSIPIIFITAYDSQETRSQAQASGASSYFQKPVDEQALLDAIAWALSPSTS